MADMKMKREGEGYLLGLTDGQLKKWSHLKREVVVSGKVQNLKWKDTSYELSIGNDVYKVGVIASQAQKSYKVTITHKQTKQSIERTYKTFECNDCIMRMLLELHNATLAQMQEEKAVAKGQKVANK